MITRAVTVERFRPLRAGRLTARNGRIYPQKTFYAARSFAEAFDIR